MTTGVEPISLKERQSRIEKARRLMAENGIDAMYLDGGTGLEYFTGVRWGRSERMLAAVIPAEGELKYVSPGFEEARLRELMTFGSDVRVWEEHESPYQRVGEILDEVGAGSGTVAMEERVRFFLYDGIRKLRPNATFVSANPVTIPCRMYKTPDEIRLMQVASDITIECYRTVIPMLEAGMRPQDFINLTAQIMTRLGVPGGRLWCSFADATAFPHGSIEPQYLKELSPRKLAGTQPRNSLVHRAPPGAAGSTVTSDAKATRNCDSWPAMSSSVLAYWNWKKVSQFQVLPPASNSPFRPTVVL